MTDLNRATVLITGANGGFGRQMSRQFLAAGCRLILSDIDRSAVEAVQADFRDAAGSILAAIASDLSTESGCRSLFDAAIRSASLPDVIVNNAGVGVAGRFDHVPADRWEKLMQINLLAPMRLCYLFLPRFIERRSGHIVNVSSIAAWAGSKGLSSYCAAKFGLRGFGEVLCEELGEFNVKVSTVYPFFSRTPILDSEQFGYDKRRRIPPGMATEPADVVAAIIDGIRHNRKEIFPDRTARKIHYIARFLPWMLPILNRRLEARILKYS